jgi:hypothetical protein
MRLIFSYPRQRLMLLPLLLLVAATTDATVTVLDNGTPLVAQISAGLSARGVANTVVDVAGAESIAAAAARRPLWIAPHFGTCPADQANTITQHLKLGGALLVLGRSPFQNLTYRWGDAWVPENAYLDAVMSGIPLLDLSSISANAFTRSTDAPTIASTLSIVSDVLPKAGGPESAQVALVQIPELSAWTMFKTPVGGTKPANALTTFWAKGSAQTNRLAVEWEEQDQSRWIATISLTLDWKFYALPPSEFRFYYNPAVTGRGGAGDYLHTENAAKFSVGLAQTHTPLGPGPHEFRFSSVGMFTGSAPSVVTLPAIDGLYPKTQTYPIKPVTAQLNSTFAETTGGTTIGALPLPASAWSNYWRPLGSGYGMLRRFRTVPIVTAYNNDGTRAGCIASVTVSHDTNFLNAVYGYVSIEDDALLTSQPWLDLVAELAQRMEMRAFLREGGSTKFTYDIRDLSGNQFQVGSRTALLNLGTGLTTSPELRVTARRGGAAVAENRWTIGASATTNRNALVMMNGSQEDLLTVDSELLLDGRTLDRITHEVGFDGPRVNQQYVYSEDRQFMRGGVPWRAFGINYLPSSGLAITNANDFEYYIENRAYDPVIIEHDLARIAALGFNSISVFIYNTSVANSHLLDLLRRARAHGFLVHLALRPATSPPLAPSNSVFDAIIPPLRLSEKDEIMGYDIAWEPWWGGYDARQAFATQWENWVLARYGTLAAAYTAWGFTPAAVAQFPSDTQLRSDGAWRVAVADYRRFVDEVLNSSYANARAHIRLLDPNHLVSFRQSEGANPFADPALYPIDIRSVSDALDYFSPEGYGIGDSYAKSQTMLFAASYAQALASGKPMIWAEYGMNVWSGDPFVVNNDLLARQAYMYRNILQNAQLSRSAGTYAWWFCGGYRAFENSDYGVLNADGTTRPVTAVLNEFAAAAKSPPDPVVWTPELFYDRNTKAPGYAAIYEAINAQFQSLTTAGTIPLVRTINAPQTPVYLGQYAARVTNLTPGPWTGDMGFDLGNGMMPVVPGQRLRVSFWMRNGNASPSVLFRASFAQFTGVDANGWGVGYLGDHRLLNNHAVPRAWTRYSFVYTVPANTNYINLSFRPGSNGSSAVLDDVHVQDLDNGSAELLPNTGLESWTGGSDNFPIGWRFFAVSGASGTIEQIGGTPSRVEEWVGY